MERKKFKRTLASVLSVLLILTIVVNGGWLSPTITVLAATGDEYQIVLSWGSDPSDLDSHITGPASNGSSFHVYYSNLQASDGDNIIASLDHDITSSYGPETITLRPVKNADRYTYYVYNFSGYGTIQTSDAKIDLYKNGSLIKSFSPPNSNSAGRTWTVFAVQNGKIYTINTISDKMNASSGTSKSTSLAAQKNDIVISPKGRLVAELESHSNIGLIDNFFEKKVNASLSQVKAEYNSKTQESTANEPFVIKADENIESDLVFSKTDFRDYVIPKKVMESWKSQSVQTPVNNSAPQYQHDAYMTQKVKDGKPYISTVFGRAGNTSDFKELGVNTLKIRDGIDYEIRISAGDLKGANCTYYLQQDQTHYVDSPTGIFTANDKVHEKLQRGKKVYAVVKTDDGKRSDYEEVKIEIEATTFLQKAQDYLKPGTKLNLLGDDFLKFTVPENLPIVGGAELSFEAFQLPAGYEFDVEEGSLKLSIGANIFEASKQKGDKKYSKEMFKDWKDLTKKSITQAYGDSVADKQRAKKQYDTNKDVFLNKWGDGAMPSKSSKNWDISALGYIEIVFNEKGYVVKEACITIEGEFSFKYTVQASVGFIPVYFYVEAGAGLGGTALGVNPVEENVQLNLTALDWDFTVKLEPKLKAGGGAGVKDFVSVGIYAKATLPIAFNFNRKHLTIDLTGEFGVEAELWLLKGSLTMLDGTVHILDKYWGSSGSRGSKSSGSVGADDDQKVEYSLVDRDYAKNTSAWLSGKNLRKARSLPQKLTLTNLQTSVYPNAVPQVVTFGDKMLMAWIEDASDRDDYNRMRLMYSVYDNGVWSQPAAVSDDGKNDNLPVIVSDGTDVYFAWQKLNSKLSESSDSTFESIMEHVEIYTARYDSATQKIVDASRVTDNGCYDYAQQLKIIGNKPVLYWASCNNNKPLENSNNTLHRLELGGSAQTVADNLNYLLDLDAASVNGVEEVSYSTDKDGDYSNTDDVTVFTCSQGTVTEFEKTNDIACPVLFYGSPQGQTKLFVSDKTNIYYRENSETKAILSESAPIDGNLQFVGDQNNNLIVWTQQEETGNAVYTVSFDNGAWTSPVSAGGNGTLLSDISAVMYQNKLSGVCTSTQLVYNDETELYENGQTNLCALSISKSQDLAVEAIDIDERSIRKGEAAPFTVLVSNLGYGTAESVTFTVSDGLGNESEQTVNVDLRSGESKTVTLNYTAPENYQKTTLSVIGFAEGFNDCNTENNTCQQEIGIPKLVITESSVIKIGSEYVLTALVTNESDLPVESAVIKLFTSYENGDEINFDVLADMAPRETHLVEFTIPEELLSFDSMDTAIVSIQSDDENVTGNKESIAIERNSASCAHPDTSVDRKEPTCTESGYERVICSACGELISETELIPLGHDTHDGTCSRCEAEITPLTLGELTKVDSKEDKDILVFSFVPDETKDYYFYSDSCYYCPEATLYNSNMEYITSDRHLADGYNFLISETLEKDKTYYFYVTNPDNENGYFVMLADSFTSCHSFTSETIPPTCDEEGYTKHTCVNCGYYYCDESVDPLGHDVHGDVCTRCGKTIGNLALNTYTAVEITDAAAPPLFRFIPPEDGTYYFYADSNSNTVGTLYDSTMKEIETNHYGAGDTNFKIEQILNKDEVYYFKAAYSYGYTGTFYICCCTEYESNHRIEVHTVEPTCENSGYDSHICSVCGYEFRDNWTSAKGHVIKRKTIPPTCQNTGYDLCRCIVCEYEYNDNWKSALEHDFTLVSRHEATCSSSGWDHVKCSACGYEADTNWVDPLDHTFEVHTINPGCSDWGRNEYKCTVCGYEYSDNWVEPLGHTGVLIRTVQPSCYEQGYDLYQCSVCGETYTENYTDVLDHNYEIITVPPTCTEQGYDIHRCTLCGGEYYDNYVDPLGGEHHYTRSYLSPTCDECGYFLYHCTICGHEYKEGTGAPLGHYGEFVRTEPPTCTKEGYDVYLCSTCGKEYFKNWVSCTPHNVTCVATIQPTCSEMGYSIYKCSDCGYEYDDNWVDCVPHNFETHTIAPTCTNAGYDLHECTICDAYYYDNWIDPTRHDLHFVETVGPTCYNNGYDLYKCSTCGEEIADNYVDPIGHNYSLRTIPPTCHDWGYDLYHCDRCGNEYTENWTEPLYREHNYVKTVVAPTCSACGYDLYKCSECGDEYIDNYTHKVPHTIENDKCTVCGKSGPELYESEHPYKPNTDAEWVIFHKNAKWTEITFSEDSEVEPDFDYVYILDKDRKEIGRYSSKDISGLTVRADGDTLIIRLVSDDAVEKYGFSLNRIEVRYGVAGDANLDGRIDIRDVTAIQRHVSELETLSDAELAAADTNGDKTVNINDATHLQMYLAEYDNVVLGKQTDTQ